MPSSRWGKINHGQSYGLLADDYALRLSVVHLTDYERILLEYIRVATWSRATRRKRKDEPFPDSDPLTESIRKIAERIGLGRLDEADIVRLTDRLYDARRGLAASNLILTVEVPPKGRQRARRGLILNPDCSTWEVGGRDVLPSYVCDGYARAVSNARPDDEYEVLDPDDEDAQNLAPTTEILRRKMLRTATKPRAKTRESARKKSAVGNMAGGPPYNPPSEAPASEDFRKTQRDKTPLPPASGGTCGVGVDQDPTFGSEFEAEVYRMVLATPGHLADRALAWSVLLQFRAAVADGHEPRAVHASYVAARADRPVKPQVWPPWVATNLANRKARQPPPPAAPQANGLPPGYDAERFARRKALQDQRYERWDEK